LFPAIDEAPANTGIPFLLGQQGRIGTAIMK